MSKRIAIVTDSNSGITQEMAKKLGVFVLPMPFVINGQTYYEDVNLSQEDFYEKLKNENEIHTSQPLTGEVLDLWDSLLKDYDELVYIPMSSGLSGACATAAMLAEDYDGRVSVVNNQRISVTLRQSVMDAMELASSGKSAEEIKSILETEKLQSSIYIMLDTLKYLKKGGRITPAAAAIATVLQIRPVLQIQGGKLDAFAKARSQNQAKIIMMDAMRQDIEKRFGGADQVRIYVAHTNQDLIAHDFAQTAERELGMKVDFCDPLSLSVSCHIGPGALAIACSKKTDSYL